MAAAAEKVEKDFMTNQCIQVLSFLGLTANMDSAGQKAGASDLNEEQLDFKTESRGMCEVVRVSSWSHFSLQDSFVYK